MSSESMHTLNSVNLEADTSIQGDQDWEEEET